MKPSELLRLVWINITQNKFKTIMTSIGIIVGAATIVMVIAIGKGGQVRSIFPMTVEIKIVVEIRIPVIHQVPV